MADGALLQDPSQCVDLLQVADPQLADEAAAAWQVHDLAFLLEHAKRLPERSYAHADLAGHILLIDSTARHQAAGNDHLAEEVEGVLLRRRRR